MNEDFYKRLGDRISALRKTRGLTQEELSAASDLTTSYLSKIEGGTRKPTLDAVGAIAEALQVSIGTMFPDDDEKVPLRLAVAVRGLPEEMLEALIGIAGKLRTASAPKRKRRPR